MTQHEHHTNHNEHSVEEHRHHEVKEDLPEGKLAIFWVFGSISMLAGSWIAGHLEWVLGTTTISYYGSLFLSLLLFLFGGLAWIGVAVGVSQHK
ncbi:MAG: hypothetical protein KAS12_00750 [Candidatus Aenigmarchaeota archaeon]|nr:hypothetical protein [Candidatus Aenigmarchaeota archaeon]